MVVAHIFLGRMVVVDSSTNFERVTFFFFEN